MSNNLFEFNFQDDQQPTENSYPISDVQWIYINDINQQNYSNSYINFTNVSIVGSDISKQYLWSQAYLTIPYTIVLTPASGMTFVQDDANVNAVSVKSYASFVDWVSCKFNGVSTTRNSYYNHLVMNERIKTYNSDKYRLYGDIMAHEWDNGYGISYSSVIGERNNNTVPVNLTTGLRPASVVNQGHLDRCAKTNIDITNVLNSSLASFMGTQNSLRDTENQNVLIYNNTDGLVFQGTATIPLSELHDFFAKMPSVSSSTGFELRLQCNIGRENSYVLTFPLIAAADANVQIPNLVTSQQIVGHCCPFLVSNPAFLGISGLSINTTAQIPANSTITARSYIGWGNQLNLTLAGANWGNANPCRIYLPSVTFNNNFIKQIIQQPQYSLKYEDFYVDIDEKKDQNSSVSRLFNVQLSRVRNLYIIPFLSNTATVPSPFNSPISSAPITCTPCRLKNFNIQIGGQNIFSEPQNLNYQFYNNNSLSIMSDINGNSLKSKFFSGQITKSMWENGYNVYSINLEKVTDEITDSLMKSFQLIEDNSSGTKLKYDFYYIISYQSELSLDRSTGTITNSV
jgi:hypothetical protein